MNYAYNGSGFTGMNVNPWQQQAAQFPSFTQGFYNSNPENALQSFIDTTHPSNVNEDVLRRMLSSIQNQWVNAQFNDLTNNRMPKPFTDFLSNYNFNQAFANLGPAQRHENPSAFNRPVRTVTF